MFTSITSFRSGIYHLSPTQSQADVEAWEQGPTRPAVVLADDPQGPGHVHIAVFRTADQGVYLEFVENVPLGTEPGCFQET